MEKFEKYKRGIINAIDISIIINVIYLIGYILIDIKFKELTVNKIWIYVIACIISFGFPIISRIFIKKDKMIGSIILLIGAIIFILNGIGTIINAVFIGEAIAYLYGYNKYYKNNSNPIE